MPQGHVLNHAFVSSRCLISSKINGFLVVQDEFEMDISFFGIIQNDDAMAIGRRRRGLFIENFCWENLPVIRKQNQILLGHNFREIPRTNCLHL